MFPGLCLPLATLVMSVVEPLAQRFGTNGHQTIEQPAPSMGTAIPMTGLSSSPGGDPCRPAQSQPFDGSVLEESISYHWIDSYLD